MKKMNVMRFIVFVALASLLAVGCATQPAQEATTEPPAQEQQETTQATQSEPTETKVQEQEVMEKEVSYAVSDLTRIHFDFDSYVLKPQARKKLDQNAEILKALSSVEIRVEGHCDERGSDEYNLALGERRAQAAMNYLIALGIDADRMSTISYGEERPLVMGHNEEAWAKNRRAEFTPK